MIRRVLPAILGILFFSPPFLLADDPIRILIVDGRNNHDWETTTDALRAILENTSRFEISVATAPEEKIPNAPYRPRNTNDAGILAGYDAAKKIYDEAVKPLREAFKDTWQQWRVDFSAHDVVVLNYNGPDWPRPMRNAFIDYVRNGGGLVLVHAANNGFRNWAEFNEMIGLGWRPAPIGRAIKIDPDSGELLVDEKAGNSGHGSKHPFPVTVRKPNHPIMRGLPGKWMHASDELYHHMRGPAKNLTVLSSAYSDPKQRGTGQHEPITWEVKYGEGRVIVTSMGHFWRGQENWDSLYCVGFQTIFARSCEYAATGEVDLPARAPFPGETTASIVPPNETSARIYDRQFGGYRNRRAFDSRDVGPVEPNRTRTEKKEDDPYCRLTPEEERTTFQLAPGYDAELVAAEPDVQEPVLTVWDGNGAMYVAEMRSYMQDIEGSGTKTAKNGRIKRLEDTDGDGRMDQVTVFVDGLNLPRMILPLDDRIAVRETDTMDIVAYRDTDGDGVADEKTTLYQRGSAGRGNTGQSVEHQDSGLIWNIDNHIYISYNAERYRFTDGKWKAEKQNGHWTQWGLDRDDEGRLFWSQNSGPLVGVQLHPKYWSNARRRMTKSFAGDPVDLGSPHDPEFMNAKSLCLLNDRGGSAPEVRAFTSACGQSVFRGNRFPIDTRGDYFFCDPTIHVVRRAHVVDRNGLTFLEKAEPKSGGDGAEFLASSDINSRFVNTATGPDGCLHVTDMYRGIIQDAPWLSPGPRKAIVEAGLDRNIQHGRIWRIRHRDHQPDRSPRMLEESTTELLRHLRHPNGWWRDTAQKLIILRDDRDTVVPLLAGMARFDQNALTRLHALWTLEGIGAVSREHLRHACADRDPRVRRAAVQISESFRAEEGLLDDLTPLARDRDGEVAEQLIFTLGQFGDAEGAIALAQEAARNHLTHRGVMLAATVTLWGMEDLPLISAIADGSAFSELNAADRVTAAANWKTILSNWDRGLSFPEDMTKEEQRALQSGEVIYYRNCVACHGADGKGVQITGTDLALAPSLVDSPRVHADDPESLIKILLHGLVGPLDGKTYQAGFMAPAPALGITRDDRLAEVLSYLRFAWKDAGETPKPQITKEQVEKLRKRHAERTTPWTEAELKEGKRR